MMDKDTRVAWSQRLAGQFPGLTLRAALVQSLDAGAARGTVVGNDNEKGTLVRVKLDDTSRVNPDLLSKDGTVVLTAEELTAISDEEPAAEPVATAADQQAMDGTEVNR